MNTTILGRDKLVRIIKTMDAMYRCTDDHGIVINGESAMMAISSAAMSVIDALAVKIDEGTAGENEYEAAMSIMLASHAIRIALERFGYDSVRYEKNAGFVAEFGEPEGEDHGEGV